MSTLPKIVAVLTGDLVKSSRLPAGILKEFPSVMEAISQEAQQMFGAALVPRMIDVFRGDSWQWLVSQPGRSVRMALFVRAALRGRFPADDVDTRIAIGVGTVESVPVGRVSQGFGPAFEASGRALESMGRRSHFALARAGDAVSPPFEGVTIGLIDALASGWTSAQARAMAGALTGKTQAEIAAQWNPAVDRSAVARHLEKAAWEPIAAALELFENVTSIDHNDL